MMEISSARPLLYDLFCSAGGTSMGYHRAGFEVVGVDIAYQPRFPFKFIQMCALEFLERYLAGKYPEAAAFGASPPCQGYGLTQQLTGKQYPLLIDAVRVLLQASGKPYVIENVPGAPLINPVWLTGSMFGLRTMRPRLFECSFDMPFVLAPPPSARHAKMGRRPLAGEYVHVVGHVSDVEYCRDAMGIDWMNRDELAEAIPPAYTEYIGRCLLDTPLFAGGVGDGE